MTRPVRFLDATTTAAISTTADTSSSLSSPPLNSDLVVILVALLCALICVLGLLAVARCAWIRRLSASSSSSTSSAPPMHSPTSAKAANKGVKKKTLRSLPKQTFSSADSSCDGKFSDCNICLTPFADGDELRVLPQCGHAFHVPCIDAWLGAHSSCPSCRRILVTSSLLNQGKINTDSWCEGCGNFQVCSSSSMSASSNSGDDGGTEKGTAKRIGEADADADAGSNNNKFLP